MLKTVVPTIGIPINRTFSNIFSQNYRMVSQSRLDDLRQLMKSNEAMLLSKNAELQSKGDASTQGIQSYIVFSEDAHQSEYVATMDQRRQWLTNFTGSTGTALVTENEALLWTDGRYYLQAEAEMDEQWKLMKLGLSSVPTIGEWLAKTMKKGSVVGIDPLLVSVAGARRLLQQLTPAGVHLAANTSNLIDELWKDRPISKNSKIELLDLQFSGEDVQSKLQKIRDEIKKCEAGALLLTSLDDIAWTFNIRGFDVPYNPVCVAYALISQHHAWLFLRNHDEFGADAKRHFGDNVEIMNYEDLNKKLMEFTKNNPQDKILLDPNQCNLSIFHCIPKDLKIEKTSVVMNRKAIKNEIEMEGMRKAHIRDGVALVQFFCWLEEAMAQGMDNLTEVMVAKKQLEFRLKQEHHVSPSFATISSVGANAAIIHYKPKEESCKTLDKTMLYLNDSGAQYLDGTTDVTRTFHFGEPSEYEKDCYTRVLQGNIALSKAIFPKGTEGYKLDTLARTFLWSIGKDYCHGTGHGVGAYLNVHEKGVHLSLRPPVCGIPLAPGMAVSNEPGYYEDGHFGIRIENVMLVNKANIPNVVGDKEFCCFETITVVPLEKKLINKDLLSPAEIQWVNDYHRKVQVVLSPYLEKDFKTLEYLRKQTTPL